MWWFVIIFIIALLAVAFLSPQAQQKTPNPGTFEGPKAEEGEIVPVLFGTADITQENVVWWGDTRADPIRKKGGKK